MAKRSSQPISPQRPSRQAVERTGFEQLQAIAIALFTRNSILRILTRIYLEHVTSAGRWFLYPTFLFALVGTFTLEHQVHVACLFSFILWCAALFGSVIFTPKVKIAARYPERVGAGEVLHVDLTVTNRGRIPAFDLAVVPHRWPGDLEMVESDHNATRRIGPGEEAHQRLDVYCGQRGVYELPGFRATTDFPFGMMCGSQVVEAPHPIMVYPEFTPLGRMEIETGRKYHPGGVALASKLGESFEYIGNREYREGDNIRDLDWNATARLGRPIIREYREEYFHRVAVVLDTHVPKRDRIAQRDAFERAVSLTAAIGDYMARQEYLVDIFAAGPDLYHLTAGRSLAYLDQILDILACVESSPNEPFEKLEPAILEHLSQITTVICVFLDWNDARREFVQRIALNGTAMKVVIARDLPLTLDPATDGSLGRVPVIVRETYEAGVDTL